MKQRLRRVLITGEDGAVLIIAIAVITVVALVTGAVLTRGDGSLRAAVGLRDAARESYAADAAAQVAINALRTGYNIGDGEPGGWAFDNTNGTGCFGYDLPASGGAAKSTLQVNNVIPKVSGDTQSAVSAVVECTPEDATGAQGSAVPINNSNKPGYAIVTLNGNLTASDPLSVHGGIYANGNITGAVTVDAGDVRATGTCTNTVVTGTATKTCGGVAAVSDPNYSDDLGGAVPTWRKPPTSCTSGVAVFEAGYYDSAATMNTASNLCNTMWFKPGTYYFDFHNSSCGTYCPSGTFGGQSSNTWSVPNGTSLVGGTPTNAAGTVLAIPPTNPTMPGSCQSPITNVNAQGVQFVFGNDSRMYLAGGSSAGAHMELCGTYNATKPPIVLFGRKTGGSLSDANANALNPSGPVTTTQPQGTWTNANAAAVSAVGGTEATWTTTGNGTKNGTIIIPGYTSGSSIPAGSILTSATLNVKHKEGDTNQSRVTIQVNGASSATAAVNLPLQAATSTADTVTFNSSTNAAAFSTLQQQVREYGFTGATTTFAARVTTNGNRTVTFDNVSLNLTYAAPVLRGETGTCVASGTSCPVLSLDSSGNNKIFMYLQGTTYAPLADISITLSNFSAEVAKFGVIARQLEYDVNTGNPSWSGPVFEIPDNSPGFGFNSTFVQMNVYLCPGITTGCTKAIANNKVALNTRVLVGDPSGSPVVNAREISILNWSHTR